MEKEGGGEAMQVYWVFIDKGVCNISESWSNNTAITLQLFKIFIWFKKLSAMKYGYYVQS